MTRTTKAFQGALFALRGGSLLSGCEDEFTLRTFHLALAAFLLWVAMMLCVVVPFLAVRKLAGAILMSAIGIFTAISLLLLRRRHKNAAATLFLSVLWCFLAIYSFFAGGLHGAGGYISVVVVVPAAWLLGIRPALGFVAATLVFSFAEAVIEATGHPVPLYFSGRPMALWVGQVGLFALTIGPVIGLARTLRLQLSALRDSEERFRSLSDASVEGIMINDGTILLNCNLAFAKMFGYERPEELIGRHPVDTLVSLESQDRIRRRITRPETEPIEVICIRKDGSLFPVETGSRPMKYQGRDARLVTCRDISERKRAVEAQQESEERYRALFERSRDCVLLADFEGRVIDANQAWMDLFGYSREDLATLTVQSLLTADQLPVAQERVGQIITQHVQKRPQEYRMRRKDGGEAFVEIQSSLLYRNGEPAAILTIGRDMTERKLAEAEKAKLEAQLHEAQKMESIGRLAGGIAHDFNNLLTVINGYSRFLMNQLDSDRGRYAEQIHKAGESAASLTRQLLAFSRMEITHPQPVHVNDVVADSREMLERLVGEDVAIETNLAASPDMVMADANRIQQCLMNLVVNGRDAMPAGGRLSIETTNVQIEWQQLPAGSNNEPGPHVRLTVRDTGVGMDEEISQRIFEPFFTTKEKGRGTGLGLSTVYGIVSQWRGFIKVLSQPGRGAEFSIYLPLCTNADHAPVVSGAEKPMPDGASETVLVVEDQEIVREFVVESMRAFGYTVLEARNGPEALEILARPNTEIHLMMTDILMPGMRGKELAARAHALCPSMKVLFMTGYADGAIDEMEGPTAGEEVLMKPFTADALQTRVRSLLRTA